MLNNDEGELIRILFEDGSAINTITDLHPGEFVDKTARACYTILLNAWLGGEVEPHTQVHDKMIKAGIPAGEVQEFFVNVFAREACPVGMIPKFVERIKSNAKRSTIVGIAHDIIKAVGSVDWDESMLYTNLTRFENVYQKKTGTKELSDGDINHLIDELDSRQTVGVKESVLKTGYIELDKLLQGARRGEQIIIAARPSVGKTSFALGIIENASIKRSNNGVLFSLEMSQQALMERLLGMVSLVDATRIREGLFREFDDGKSDWGALSRGSILLRKLLGRLVINNESYLNVDSIVSFVRMVAKKKKLDYVVIDYLQLITETGAKGAANNGSRNYEIGYICRTLRTEIARKLNVPLFLLAQLSRGIETRTAKMPLLSDLRDCVTGDMKVVDADSGEELYVKDIVDNRMKPYVWSFDENMQLIKRQVVESWLVGEREVVKVKTRGGFEIECTMNHRFFNGEDYVKLSDMCVGSMIGLYRGYEVKKNDDWREGLLIGWLLGDGWIGKYSMELTVRNECEARYAAFLGKRLGLTARIEQDKRGKNAYKVVYSSVANWLRDKDLQNVSVHKHIPAWVYMKGNEYVASLLRGLFHADGSFKVKNQEISYCSISETLIKQVHNLLLRLGIFSSISKAQQSKSGYIGKNKYINTLNISSYERVIHFMDKIGFLGRKRRICIQKKKVASGVFDRLPLSVNKRISKLLGVGVVSRKYKWRDQSKHISRYVAEKWGNVTGDLYLKRIANSQLYWDRIVSIELAGVKKVYDITVEGEHNLFINGILCHNSGETEQHADVVIFLHRESKKPGIIQFVVAKHRNGPTGVANIGWIPQYARFENILKEDKRVDEPKDIY